MADIQSVKNQLMGLSYQEKIQMSEWLHTQIDFERAEEVKRKSKEFSGKLDNFLTKAISVTKKTGNSIVDQFRGATNNDNTPTKQ